MNCYLNHKTKIVIALSALGSAIVIGLASFWIMDTYRRVQPIWVEQAAYGQWPMVIFLQSLRSEGFLSASFHYLGTRHLLQLWTLGLLMPSALGWFQAPLLVALMDFVIFLCLFGWTVYKRTQHLGYAVASMVLYGALAQLTWHNWGIGSGFADWQSMFLLSAAVLCLINALMQPSLTWIRFFAILVLLSTLARTTSVFHALAMCGPILLIYTVALYQRYRSFRLLSITFLNILVIITPALLIVFRQLSGLLAYYNPAHAWNLRQPFITSASNIFLTLLVPFMGIPLIAFCVILLVLNTSQLGLTKQLFWKRGNRNDHLVGWTEVAVAWWGFGFFFYLLLNGYTSDVPKEVMYAVPPLLFGAISPFAFHKLEDPKNLKWLSWVIVAFSTVSFGWYTFRNIKWAGTITPDMVDWRQTQVHMAAMISKTPKESKWQSYTPVDWSIPVSLLTLYKYGEFHGSPEYFYNMKEYWDAAYPGLSLSELQRKLYAKTSDCIDVAVVLKYPDKQPARMEEYSYSIAAFIARSIQSDNRWRFIGELYASPSGAQLALYMNTAATHSVECSK